jgi:hypothetical protein
LREIKRENFATLASFARDKNKKILACFAALREIKRDLLLNFMYGVELC